MVAGEVLEPPMTDPGLKLPLRVIASGAHELEIFDDYSMLVASVWCYDGDETIAQHRAEVIVAALTADAELGAPPCECCTKKGTEPYWHQECDCMNQGDLADAADWCARANLIGWSPDAEKGERDG